MGRSEKQRNDRVGSVLGVTMKYIELKQAAWINIGAGKSMSHKEFLLQLTRDRYFGQSLDHIYAGVAIRQAVKDAATHVALEDADYARLRQALETPVDGYDPEIMYQCIPFVEAIKNPSAAPAESAIATAQMSS